MGGFESVQADCIIYLFAGWVLDTRTKFALGALGTFVLAILCEYLTWVRRSYLSASPSIRLFRGRRRLLKAVKASLFTTQATLGYFLMLVAMTYQVPPPPPPPPPTPPTPTPTPRSATLYRALPRAAALCPHAEASCLRA